MLKEDLALRRRAAAGDGDAAVKLGLKYLTGAPSMAPNYKLALKLLSPHAPASAAVRSRLAQSAPLEALIEAEQMQVLRDIADAGGAIAAAKLGVWLVLTGDEEGWRWLSSAPAGESNASLDEKLLEANLFDRTLMSAEKVADLLLGQSENSHTLRLALNVLLVRMADSTAVRRTALSIIRDAESARREIAPLRSEVLSAWLANAGGKASTYANFILGRAQLGMPCGRIQAAEIATKRNYRGGFARLLRAAHGGKREAWFALFEACSDYRSVVANAEAAEFFLEQAANAGIARAQTILGARTLKQATSLADILTGQQWLSQSAYEGDEEAQDLLRSFLPSSMGLEQSRVEAALSSLELADRNLALRLKVARAFGLKRTEALKLALEQCAEPSSLVVVRTGKLGYAIPATTREANSLLAGLRKQGTCSALRTAAREHESFLDGWLWDNRLGEEDFFCASPIRDFAAWRLANGSMLKRISAPSTLS